MPLLIFRGVNLNVVLLLILRLIPILSDRYATFLKHYYQSKEADKYQITVK